jgi:hypothetical protein
MGVMLAIYFAHERVLFPELPWWLDPVGEFVTGGLYLTLIAAPFTAGLFLLFHTSSE